MIDWLSSKIGTLIAIGVVTGFVLALFAWQHSVMVDREGQTVADNLSCIIESMGGLEAETLVNITFGNEVGQLPGSINGKAYEINITANMVMVSQNQRQWVSGFLGPVICQNLTERRFNLTEYGNLSTAASTGRFASGGAIVMERASIDISGDIKYITLIYNK